MINDLPKYIIICLSCTIVIEIVISIILKIRDKKDLINIMLANILTNPIVVTIPFSLNIFYGIKYYYLSLIILEILTIFVEGLIYKKYLKYHIINPYILSLILNVASYGIGLIINKFI